MDSSQFLTAVKRAITVPQYQARFTDDDLLALANEEQETLVVPTVLSLREEYFVVRDEVPVVSGQSKVGIPKRALGRALREVHFKLANGNYYNLPRYSIENSYPYLNASVTGNPTGFYIMADAIYLAPTSNTAGTAALWYFLRPNSIVPTARTGAITALTESTVTLNKVPSNITVGGLIDITAYQPGYQLAYKDLTVTNISGKTLTLAGFDLANPIADVAVGDSVSSALETSILQLPTEVQNVLIWAVCVRVLEALAIPEQLKIAQDKLKVNVQACSELLSPRIEGELPKVIQVNNLLRSTNSFAGYYTFRP